MDRELLSALQNIGNQLDILADVLSKRNDSTSDVTNVLSSGDFSEELKTISTEIRSIKSDTQEIIKLQQTILSISKEKEKDKTEVFEDSSKQESNIGKGVTVIIGIAAAVLAVGTAFKLVGEVNVASVLSLSIAIGIMALSFEKIVNTEKLSITNVLLASAVIVSMSVGILLSSYILNGISDVSNEKLLTSIGIAAAFGVISLGIGKLLTGIKDVKSSDIIPLTIGMLFILPAISAGIVLSSYMLQFVYPISLSQMFSAILVSGLFVVLSYGIKNIVKAFKDISPEEAISVGFGAPIMFIGLSFAIAGSSLALSLVQEIEFTQFITALGISILFVGLSYAIKPILNATSGIKPLDVLTIPLLFTTMSIAISASSKFLKDTEIIDFVDILKIVALGVGMAIAVTAMVIPVKIASKIGLSNIIKGSVAILVIAGVISLSSKLLALGDYSNSPNVDWALGTGLALSGFAVGAAILGLAVFGPQAFIFAAGLVATLGVAATIVAVSKILKEGDYNMPNMLGWATSTALLYAIFAPIMVILGGISLASGVLSVFGVNPWENAKKMMLSIADTIVEVSSILNKGTYIGGPTKEWAQGVGISIGAFSPVYGMLVANKVASIFGGSGGIGPDDFNKAIKTVADGIISVSDKFGGTKFSMGPSKEWSEGVGTAIGAFSPVYGMLVANKVASIFGGGIGPDDFNKAIEAVSLGIIETAKIFSNPDNIVKFEEGKYPSKNWGEGIGTAIGAFSPIFELIGNSGFWKSDKSAVDGLLYGIISVSEGIVQTAELFDNKSFNNKVNPDFVKNLSKNILDYIQLTKDIKATDTSGYLDFFKMDPVVSIAKNINLLAKSYRNLSSSLVSLSSTMKLLNVDNLKSLVILTKSMVDPSVKVETVANLGGGTPSVNVPTQQVVSSKVELNTKSLEEKLDKMIGLLNNISSTTISLDETTQLISEERIKNYDI